MGFVSFSSTRSILIKLASRQSLTAFACQPSSRGYFFFLFARRIGSSHNERRISDGSFPSFPSFAAERDAGQRTHGRERGWLKYFFPAVAELSGKCWFASAFRSRIVLGFSASFFLLAFRSVSVPMSVIPTMHTSALKSVQAQWNQSVSQR